MTVLILIVAGLLTFGLAAPASAITVDVMTFIKYDNLTVASRFRTIMLRERDLLWDRSDLVTLSDILTPDQTEIAARTQKTHSAVWFYGDPVAVSASRDTEVSGVPQVTVSYGALTFLRFGNDRKYRRVAGLRTMNVAPFGVFSRTFGSSLSSDTVPDRFDLRVQGTQTAPVPVPASFPLLAGAFGLLAFARRRRMRPGLVCRRMRPGLVWGDGRA